jgi:hypothetical protein
MFNQKLFSILQVFAQALFSFSFLSTLIKSANDVDYVEWSVSFSVVSAIFSLNIFSGVLFNKFIASGNYSTNIIFLNGIGLIIISTLMIMYGLFSNANIYFYLAILFSSVMQLHLSLCNMVDGLGKLIARCKAQIIIFIIFSLILFLAMHLNVSIVTILILALLSYILIGIICIFIVIANKSWDFSLPQYDWSILISQNSYSIGRSVIQSSIEPLIKYNLLAYGATNLIILFDVTTRIASTIRTFIASLNIPLITVWSKKYSQTLFNKELMINIFLAATLNITYLYFSSIIFFLLFDIEEQNFLFTSIIISTYFLLTLQNLPNISNIALNKLDRNFYASLLVLISVSTGNFFVSNAEYYIFSYLIGSIFSTAYLFSYSR